MTSCSRIFCDAIAVFPFSHDDSLVRPNVGEHLPGLARRPLDLQPHDPIGLSQPDMLLESGSRRAHKLIS